MVAVHFSTVCGAKCGFCYAGDSLQLKQLQTPTNRVTDILDRLHHGGVKEILFVGGDPVLHPDFHFSLRRCSELGLITTVLSNSWSIKPKDSIHEIAGLIGHMEATFLGHDEKLHDELTGSRGSYRRLIENLKEIDRPFGVCINAMPQNLDHIFDTVASLYREGAKSITSLNIQRIIPSGSAGGTFKFGLKLEDVDLLMRQIERIDKQFNIPISFEDPVPWCTTTEKYHRYLNRCDWGYSKGSINHNGDITRCGADDTYRLGSVFDGDLQERWNNHPILKSFRNKQYLADECQTCIYLEKCGGGCPLSCGTCKDHALDALYIEKKSHSVVTDRELLKPSNPSGKQVTRSAFPADWDAICDAEHDIFIERADVLFTPSILKKFSKVYPKLLYLTEKQGQVMGYLCAVPLTTAGSEKLSKGAAFSLLSLEESDIAGSMAKSSGSVLLEVIAFRDECLHKDRISLLRKLITMLRDESMTFYALAITPIGVEVLEKHGFKRISDHTSSVALYKR